MVEVTDLDALVATLEGVSVRFRGPVIDGISGRQVIVEDPSGNPVELFSPIRTDARVDQT